MADTNYEDVGAAITGRKPHPIDSFPPSPNVKDMRDDWADVNFPWVQLQYGGGPKAGQSVQRLPQTISGELAGAEATREGRPDIMESFTTPPETPLGVQAGVRDVKPITPEELMRFLMVNEATNPDPRLLPRQGEVPLPRERPKNVGS